MEATSLSEARIYVGTYAKYNDGSIEGKWFDLSDFSDKDEFYEACKELHEDEEDPEYMFQDWENIPDELIGESWLSDNFFDFRDADGNDLMKDQIQLNYDRIKQDVKQIVIDEIERVKNDPDLQHLVKEE